MIYKLIMNKIRFIITLSLLTLLTALPSVAEAQVNNSKTKNPKQQQNINVPKGRKPIQANKLEVTDTNDKEYKGVVNQPTQKNNKGYMDESEIDVDIDEPQEDYRRPYLINGTDDDEEEERPNLFQTSREDEGAESEDDILMAGDSTLIHIPKLDITTLTDPVTIQLTDPQHGEMFVFPTPDISRATSHFGPRRRRFHYGVDLAMPTGEPIYAAFDGVVRLSKYNRSYGNLIVIRHNNGLETYYAHLSKRHVTPGTQVRAGDIIGLCGNTGRSYGSHLHFEIRYQGNALNPEEVIDCETRVLLSQTLTLTKDSFRKVAKKGTTNQKGKQSTTTRSSNYSKDGKYYKVRSGDTLGRIAKRNGTTVAKLCKLNGLKENSVLQIGQRIRIR